MFLPPLFSSVCPCQLLFYHCKIQMWPHPSGEGIQGKGEEWWTTYWQFQLEALVDRMRGREPEVWLKKQDSVDTGVTTEYQPNFNIQIQSFCSASYDL